MTKLEKEVESLRSRARRQKTELGVLGNFDSLKKYPLCAKLGPSLQAIHKDAKERPWLREPKFFSKSQDSARKSVLG